MIINKLFYICITLIILMGCLPINGMSANKLDSLKKVYTSSSVDTTRVQTAYRIVRELVNKKGEREVAQKYAEEMLELSQKIEYQEGLALAYIAKAIIVSEQGKKEEAIDYLNRSVEISKTFKETILLGLCYGNLGRQYKSLGKYKIALDYFMKALDLAEKRKDLVNIANLYNSIGTIYEREGNYPQALFHFQRCRKLYETSKHPEKQGMVLINLGNIYEAQNDLKQALSYYKQAEGIMRKTDDLNGVSNALNNIGNIYKKKKELDRALDYYQKSLEISQKMRDDVGISIRLSSIGDFYFETKQYPKAIDFYTRSLSITEKIQIAEGRVTALINLGAAYFKLKDYSNAKKYLLKGYTLSQKIQQLELSMRGAKLLAQTDSATQNYRSAYDYRVLYHLYKDSMYNAEQSKSFGNLESQYKYDMEKLSREQAEREKEKVRTIQYGFIGGVFLIVLLVTGFLFYNNRAKYRTNLVLAEKNNALLGANEQILSQKAELENAYEELNATLEQIKEQKEDIEEQTLKIQDSIRYAYQIQTAILPDSGVLASVVSDHFIFYQPKDIVSGDFYWMSIRDNLLFFCVADCTGHGVPGAFMSVVGSNALHSAVNELSLTEPNVILHEIDRKIRSILRQEINSESKDGMDICLCVLNTDSLLLQFAGAGRSLYHFSQGSLVEIKGNKFPIGGGQHENKLFTTHEISLQTGDRLYLFTDGITDQFGGMQKRKFTPKRLQEFILEYQNESIAYQGKLFHQTMSNWMAGHKQLDDLTLIALQV